MLKSVNYSSGISKKQQLAFGGLDTRRGAYDGAIAAEVGLSSRCYPVLATRPKRVTVVTGAAGHRLSGLLYTGDYLCWVDETASGLTWSGTVYRMDDVWGSGGSKSLTEVTCSDGRRLLQCGGWITVWPDKKYITATGDWSSASVLSMEASCTSSADAVTLGDGTIYGEAAEANTLTYTGVEIDGKFAVGDAVRISGTNDGTNDKTAIIREVVTDDTTNKTQLRFSELCFDLGNSTYTSGAGEISFSVSGSTVTMTTTGAVFPDSFVAGKKVKVSGCTTATDCNGTWDLTGRDNDGKSISWSKSGSGTMTGSESGVIVVAGATTSETQTGAVTISRVVPVSSGYPLFADAARLWGIEPPYTIHCCKQGEPWVWEDYEGTADGCWAVDDYSAGKFTGGISYLSYPTFFKARSLEEIYGTRPANYQLEPSMTCGVLEGCRDSLAIAGDKLYYVNRNGVYVYGGGTPSCISATLEGYTFGDAVAGSNGRDYYVCATLQDETRHLLVYDTVNGLWHDQGEIDIREMCYAFGQLYAIQRTTTDSVTTYSIVIIDRHDYDLKDTDTEETAVSWYMETGDIEESTANYKGVIKLQLRAELAPGAELTAYISYDGGAWQSLPAVGQTYTLKNTGTTNSIVAIDYIPMVPHRVDRYRIKLAGTGETYIYELTRETYTGSEV